MQVVSNLVGGFKPFDITLRVETVEEAQNLFAIFNYSGVSSLFPSVVTQDIRDELRPQFHGPYEPGMVRLKESLSRYAK